MYDDLLIVIMARAGSKRIPNKNFKELNRKPLINYTIEAAINSDLTSHIWVSTDKKDFEDNRVKIYQRPEEDAGDNISAQASLLNTISGNKLDYFKNIIMLLPTNPFRDAKILKSIYEYYKYLIKYDCSGIKSLVTINRFIETFAWRVPIDSSNIRRSQDLEDEFCLNGAIWISNIKHLMSCRTFYHNYLYYCKIPFINGFDIDTQEDWEIAEILGKGLNRSDKH